MQIKRVSLSLLARALAPDRVEHLRAVAGQSRPLLAGRIVWNVNSTFIIERSRQLSTIHRRASGFRPYRRDAS